MTTYRAVVKYALDDDRDAKVCALREGLSFIAAELAGEHGVSLYEIEDWLDCALQAAEDEAATP